VSDHCCTTSVYYEPPPSHSPDWDGDIPWIFILPIILFAAALIWLWYLTPEKKKETKTVSEQVTAAFNQASNDADAYTRPEVQRPLARVRDKVLEILRAEGIQ
jgi:hypothetical protein